MSDILPLTPDAQKALDNAGRETRDAEAQKEETAKTNISGVVTFCRKRLTPGIYTGNVDSKNVVRIVNRGLYATSKPKEVKFLLGDPEIMEYKTDKKGRVV